MFEKMEVRAAKFRNRFNRIFPNSKKEYFVSAIITSAGSGTRLGGVSKPLFLLQDNPCILYSLLVFQNHPEVREIIVVARAEDREEIGSICRRHNITKLKEIVIGGNTRQESVANGFYKISEKSDLVAIHDAARPLICAEDLHILFHDAKRFGASCASNPVFDTVKKANARGLIEKTISRKDLFQVQTPQVFKSDLYRAALALALREKIEVTDDASIAEFAGFPVKLSNTSRKNLKLTTPEDVVLINTFLKERTK